MSSIRGVMLLPINAKSYRSHTAHHTFINKVNAPETVADPNLALSRLVENRHIQNRFFVRFRELDGVFEAGNRTTVILEVKASARKSSIKFGHPDCRKTAPMGSL